MVARTGLVAALGLNLWALGAVIPLAFSRAGAGWALAPLGPLALAAGLRRRSDALLLAGVPIAATAPLALPSLEAARQHPVGFLAVTASLVAYVVAALRALESGAGPPAHVRTLDDAEPIAPRWRRRRRIYRAMAALAVTLPSLLLHAAVLHRPTLLSAVGASAGADAERAVSLLVAAVALLSALVFALCLARPLADHLGHDLAVRVRIERSRLLARRGRPRPLFYVSVAGALLLMALVVALRGGFAR